MTSIVFKMTLTFISTTADTTEIQIMIGITSNRNHHFDLHYLVWAAFLVTIHRFLHYDWYMTAFHLSLVPQTKLFQDQSRKVARSVKNSFWQFVSTNQLNTYQLILIFISFFVIFSIYTTTLLIIIEVRVLSCVMDYAILYLMIWDIKRRCVLCRCKYNSIRLTFYWLIVSPFIAIISSLFGKINFFIFYYLNYVLPYRQDKKCKSL